MLCDNCGGDVKPVVALDIDGTLGNYHEHFTWFCQQYFGMKRPLGYWRGYGEFEDWLGITKIQYREAKLAYRQGGMKRWMPVYHGVPDIIRSLRSLGGASVWIATTRPWQRLDNIDPDTKEWLRRNEIQIDGLLYGEDKYQLLCESVDPARICGVIDDLPEQIEKAKARKLPAMLRTNFHNAATSENIRPKGTLGDCAVWLEGQVARWNSSYRKVGNVQS